MVLISHDEQSRDFFQQVVRCAREKTGPYSGGFDILKKWQREQTGQKDDAEYYTSGFDIVRKWQKEHGTQPRVPGQKKDTPVPGGFDIVRHFQKTKGK